MKGFKGFDKDMSRNDSLTRCEGNSFMDEMEKKAAQVSK